MALRTVQAVRQILYSTLTSPAITYYVNGGSLITLSAANVASYEPADIAVGMGTQPPSPLITFTVGTRKNVSQMNERLLRAKVWVSSTADADDVTELYEQGVRARLHMAGFQGSDSEIAPPNISRITTSGNSLGAAIRLCEETTCEPVAYDEKTARWYLYAEYRIYAR